jgi:glycosyltransferase involved in cell wall biosynthesis
MFSVVIPVYNHERFLREAVESALKSELVKEVLLCDDGSKDGSAELCARLAREYPDRVRDYSDFPSVNRGAHNRLNQLCKLSSQLWIRVLNSDDFFLPRSFETIRMLAHTQSATCISGSMLICDENSKICGTKKGVTDPEYPLPAAPPIKPLLKNQEILKLLLNQNFIATTSNMAFTRELFDRIGGFSDFRYAHDLDFALRATMHGTAIHASAYLVTYRTHTSNTISETSSHMDGEITRLYSRFLNDFPEVEDNIEALHFLKQNKHIEPFPTNHLKTFRKSPQNKVADYYLPPSLPEYALPNVLLALGCLNYDFVITSYSLLEAPEIDSTDLSDSLASFGSACCITKEGRINHSRGRIIRCPQKMSVSQKTRHAKTLFPGHSISTSDADILIGKPPALLPEIRTQLFNLLKTKLQSTHDDDRPVVFVLPIFLAVGGVERNTIEVIRLLESKYRFIIVTSEYLSTGQGSLHWQLYEFGIPVFDLAEIADQKYHEHLISSLVEIVTPQMIWICNGSPWLVKNSTKLRRIFAGISIIDQQVYDTNEGWINHYHNKGIQSFDHFIAINSKIRDSFLNRLRIPKHRISLIYPMLSDEKVLSARKLLSDRKTYREALGISSKYSKVFTFVGRLCDQKKPLIFLDFVRLAKKNDLDCFFLMIGDGELANECNKLIQKNQLDNIKRIPFHPSPPEVMALSDGMIITSIYEGLPIAMLEALGVGVPVLATDVGDVRMVLERFNSGQIFANDSPLISSDQCYKRFQSFVQELPLLTSHAMNSRDEICSYFGKKQISDKYDMLFRSYLYTIT